ncbi:MAG: hypothetical protein ACRD5J_15490 [Nitrososphaeraceae archaeon]
MLENINCAKYVALSSTVTFCLVVALAVAIVTSAFSVQEPLKLVQAQVQRQQQQQLPQETFFESAIRTANETAGNQSQRQQQEDLETDPTLNADFVRQGQISSQLVQLREGEQPQTAIILPIRDDNAIYSGIITYQASRPVNSIILNLLNPGNTTAIPEEFGDLGDIIRLNGQLVSISEIGSGESGSMPFTGNAIGFISEEDDPFIVTYTLTAVPEHGRIINDITSILGFNASLSSDQVEEAEEDEEGGE